MSVVTSPGLASLFPFTTNTVLAANDGLGDQVVTVNLNTGALTPFVQHLQTSKGLVYLNANGTQTQLALNGSTSAAASTSASKSGESDNTLTIVLIIIGVVILGGGGYLLARRRPRTG